MKQPKKRNAKIRAVTFAAATAVTIGATGVGSADTAITGATPFDSAFGDQKIMVSDKTVTKKKAAAKKKATPKKKAAAKKKAAPKKKATKKKAVR